MGLGLGHLRRVIPEIVQLGRNRPFGWQFCVRVAFLRDELAADFGRCQAGIEAVGAKLGIRLLMVRSFLCRLQNLYSPLRWRKVAECAVVFPLRGQARDQCKAFLFHHSQSGKPYVDSGQISPPSGAALLVAFGKMSER